MVDLGSDNNLSELAVWHKYTNKEKYYNHTIAVRSNTTSIWTQLRETTHQEINTGTATSIIDTSEQESSAGIRYSIYQNYPMENSTITPGKYYIIPLNNLQNKALVDSNGTLNYTYTFRGLENQQWDISINSNNTYKIVNKETKRAISINNQNVILEDINENNANENWNIVGSKSGYYHIKSQNKYLSTTGSVIYTSNSELTGFKFIKIPE